MYLIILLLFIYLFIVAWMPYDKLHGCASFKHTLKHKHTCEHTVQFVLISTNYSVKK